MLFAHVVDVPAAVVCDGCLRLLFVVAVVVDLAAVAVVVDVATSDNVVVCS